MSALQQFGHMNPETGGDCCGKPRGCRVTSDACMLLTHPIKRASLHGDTTVRCQATCVRPHPDTGEEVGMQCVLNHGHLGACDPQPRAMGRT